MRSKKVKFKWSIGESILSVLIVIIISINLWRYFNLDKVNDLYSESLRSTEVLDRYMTGAGYKVSSRFILVLKDKKSNRIFDLEVTPSTYYQGKVGNTLNFRLSKYDIGYRGDKFITKLHDHEYVVSSIFLIFIISVFSLVPSVGEYDSGKCLRYIVCINVLNILLIVLLFLI